MSVCKHYNNIHTSILGVVGDKYDPINTIQKINNIYELVSEICINYKELEDI